MGKKRKADGTDRPKPPSTRTAEHAKSLKIFALLVGIDQYEGSITPLKGCEKDVELISNFLTTRYPEQQLRIKTLSKPEETDKQTIIDTFKSHLIESGGTGIDTFWFHFSGHGSEQFTAEEFFRPMDGDTPLPSLEPSGKDQVLVCHNPGGSQTGIFLADKELAALIEELHQRIPAIDDQKPHIIVTLDCCHAGTGTRDFNLTELARQHSFIPANTSREDGIEQGLVRTIDDYHGNFSDRLAAGNFSLPQAPHLLISACKSTEKAKETIDGGFLTQELITILSEAHAQSRALNYDQLFTQTLKAVRTINDEQTPQFEPVGGFNPYTASLEGWELGDRQQFEVFQPAGRSSWFVRCGAIHGLPVRSEEKVMLQIYQDNPVEFLTFATVRRVGVEDSRIRFTDFEITEEMASRGLFAEIFSLPAHARFVQASGDTGENLEMLKEAWSNLEIGNNLENLNIQLHTNGPVNPTEAEIIVTEDGRYTLQEPNNGSILLEEQLEEGEEELSFRRLKLGVEKVINWKRLYELNNEKSKLQNAFDLEFRTIDFSRWLEKDEPDVEEEFMIFHAAMELHEGEDIVILGDKESFITEENAEDMKLAPDRDSIVYSIRLVSRASDLNYYFYDFKDNYDIKLISHISLSNPTGTEGQFLIQSGFIGLRDDELASTNRYKLIVTRKPLVNPATLEQTGFPFTKDTTATIKFASDINDWFCKNITVTMQRKSEAAPAKPAEPLGPIDPNDPSILD
ncbi:MAG: caspase family protein [Bacteroidota bacterium]